MRSLAAACLATAACAGAGGAPLLAAPPDLVPADPEAVDHLGPDAAEVRAVLERARPIDLEAGGAVMWSGL